MDNFKFDRKDIDKEKIGASFSDDILKRVETMQQPPKEIEGLKYTGKHINNLQQDKKYGQEWNVGNLNSLDNLFLLSNNKDNFDLIDELYEVLLKLNPDLKNIILPNNNDKYAIVLNPPSPLKSAKLDIIRGVASGLHLNDIKFFVEKLKGDADNAKILHFMKETRAFNHYKNKYGKSMEFSLSPETIKKIIKNESYNDDSHT